MSKGKRYQVTVGGQLVDAFSKAAAERRVRALVAAESRCAGRGFKVEVQQLDGSIDAVTDLSDACRAYGAEFRVMISTYLGRDPELQDMFRMNIGDNIVPAYAVRNIEAVQQ